MTYHLNSPVGCCADKKSKRFPGLSCVRIKDGVAVATDGRILAMTDVDYVHDSSILLPSKAATHNRPKPGTDVPYDAENDVDQDAAFPRLDDVVYNTAIDGEEQFVSVVFDGALLAKLLAGIGAAKGEHTRVAISIGTGACLGKAAVVSGEHGAGIIMPCEANTKPLMQTFTSLRKHV